MVFLTKTDGYQKMCDTNKNVAQMGMIVKRVYYTVNHSQPIQERMRSAEHPLSSTEDALQGLSHFRTSVGDQD
jgi:hypothetical protein